MRNMETTDDVEKPLSESWDSDSTDETIGIDNHKQPRKQKGQKKYNEMHPGWWPQRYAPSNGANRSIRAGMREKIRQYEEAGRDPRDMWDEYGNDGCMVKAIKNNPRAKTRLTKATFERVQLPFTITKPGRNRTLARLNGDFMLRSDDISRCTKLLHPADEWHIFDPGYPSENSVLQRLRTRANNFVFFLHAKCHWSLCHLDRKSGQLNHFNSMRHTDMPVSGLVSWLSKHPSIKLTCRITIHEKDCPQQEDAFNCGIFALAFLQSLVNGEGIPTQVNARELRTFFAMHIEGNGPPEREITVQETTSTSCQTPPELINPVNRSVSLPADSSIPASFLAESQNFLKSWRREKGRLAMATKTFEQKATKLSTLEDELTLVRQRLQKSEETVRELRKQIKESGDTETLHNDIRDLIAKLPPAEGSNFHSKWLKSKSLPKRLSNAESELDGTRKRITQLEGQIQLRRNGPRGNR
ncbi:hypothetical protein QL093DRAFT_2570759 [Fusarium oxysporum]|nr:hypothetical protein QL093DRAFT_2570759 [Fusarium oxysporum]